MRPSARLTARRRTLRNLLLAITLCGCGIGPYNIGFGGGNGGHYEDEGTFGDYWGDGLDDETDEIRPGDDSDGDRLDDDEEVAIGTDPFDYDTDRDGYADGDEVLEGSDPLNAASVIYIGGWPYYWDKDSIGGSYDAPIVEGVAVMRHIDSDQYGDLVDLYDFGGSENGHEYVLVLMHKGWYPGVYTEALRWLAGVTPSATLDAAYGDVKAAVDDGRVEVVILYAENSAGQPVGPADLQQLGNALGGRLPIVADSQLRFGSRIDDATGGVSPGMLGLKANNMKVRAVGDPLVVLDWLSSKL